MGINDRERVDYLWYYVDEVLKAVKLDGVIVHGYFATSLLDGFQWNTGEYIYKHMCFLA